MRFVVAVLLACLSFDATAAAAPAPTVAVLYFDYQGKNEEMSLLKKGLAQMIISDLSGNKAYQIVERDRLQEVIAELKLAKSKMIDKKSAARIGKLLGARYMILGGYFDAFGTLRVDARVVETETGRVLKSVGANAKPEEFIQLESKLADDLEAILVSELKAPDNIKERKKRTKRRPKKLRTKTALRYAKALDAKDRGDKATAKKELQKVVKEQPDFQIAQVDLQSLMK